MLPTLALPRPDTAPTTGPVLPTLVIGKDTTDNTGPVLPTLALGIGNDTPDTTNTGGASGTAGVGDPALPTLAVPEPDFPGFVRTPPASAPAPPPGTTETAPQGPVTVLPTVLLDD